MSNMEKTAMTTTVTLPICCMCKRVSTEEDGSSGQWVKLQRYLDRHQMGRADFQLTHTYCPACFDRQARAWHLQHVAPAPLKRSA